MWARRERSTSTVITIRQACSQRLATTPPKRSPSGFSLSSAPARSTLLGDRRGRPRAGSHGEASKGRADLTMNQFVLIVGSGLITAALLAVAGVGFTLQFSVTNVLNVAYGSIMSVSAFVAYEVNNAGANLWVSGIVAAGTGAALSLAMHRGVFKPFEGRGAGVFTLIILSLAISLILENALLIAGGPHFFSYGQLGQPSVRIAGVGFTPSQVIMVAIAGVLMFLVHAIQKWTKLGKAMRATATNPELAKSCGVRTGIVVDIAWIVSGTLCGLAGLFMG